MQNLKKTWILAIGALMAVFMSPSSPAHASTYSPGTATAHKPVYNAITGNWDYYCSFNNWRSGAVVQWQCRLLQFGCDDMGCSDYVRVATHSGSWTPPPAYKTTATFHYPMIPGQGYECTQAYGLSVDGGVTSAKVCNY